MSISSLSGPRSQIASTHSWTFSKKHLNILVDVTVFLGFLALVFSGLLMTLVLPRGSAGGAGGALNLWGLNRHQWGDLHLWVAIGFMGIVAVHLVLHRTWIWGAVTGGARASKSRRVAGIIILGIGLALAVGAAGTPFLLKRRHAAMLLLEKICVDSTTAGANIGARRSNSPACRASKGAAMKTGTIDPLAAYQMMQQDTTSVLLDVRTPMEYQRAHVAGSIHVPLDMLSRAGLPAECDTRHNVLLLCKSGARAARARELLHNTCPAASVIQGGIAAWQLAGLPVVKGAHQSKPLMQQVQIVAGLITLVGSLLTLLHPAFIIVPIFIGTGLTLSGLTGACPMACVLARMPWNRIACTGPLREGQDRVSHV